jgi:hypothetical protein
MPAAVGEALHEADDARALLRREGQRLASVGAQAALAFADHRALGEQVGLGAALQLHQQLADHAAGRAPLDPARLAVDQRRAIGGEEDAVELVRAARAEAHLVPRHVHADHESNEVAPEGTQRAIVEIADVEIDQPVVAAIGAEILDVQIAVEPHRRHLLQPGLARPIGMEQMIGAAEIAERRRRHLAVFERQQLRLAAAVEGGDLFQRIGATRHAPMVMPLRRPRDIAPRHLSVRRQRLKGLIPASQRPAGAWRGLPHKSQPNNRKALRPRHGQFCPFGFRAIPGASARS